MELGIRGKNALVLGASQGIGRGIACSLAREGVNLLLAARNQPELEALAGRLRTDHAIQADVLQLDLDEAEASGRVKSMMDAGQFPPDILVNISGGPGMGDVTEIPAAEYERYFQGMVASLIDITRLVVADMAARKWGRVVTVASSGVTQPIKGLAVSNTLRAGLVAWNKTLAAAVARDGITVNTLIPGRIATSRLENIDRQRAAATGVSHQALVAASHAVIPAGRYGTVEEFAATATFLCSEQAGYITGSCIRVDGGLIASIY